MAARHLSQALSLSLSLSLSLEHLHLRTPPRFPFCKGSEPAAFCKAPEPCAERGIISMPITWVSRRAGLGGDAGSHLLVPQVGISVDDIHRDAERAVVHAVELDLAGAGAEGL